MLIYLSNSFIFGCAGSLMQSTGLSVAAHGLSLVAVRGDYSLVLVPGLLTAAVSPIAEHRLSSWAHGLSCLRVCGISPDQGSNQCSLQWQADS